MKIRLDKETAWKDEKSVIQYYIWADGKCIEIAYTEEEAFRKYENVKTNYVGSSKTVLKEEEI